MASKSLAAILRYPRLTCGIALASIVAASSVGCSHNRQSYRPVYGRPVTTAPCTNCGVGGSSSAISGSSVTTESSDSSTSSAVPSLSSPTSSSAVPSSPPAPVSAGAGPSPEAPPKARVGGFQEPGFNDLEPVGGAASSARPTGKSKPNANTGSTTPVPDLSGPNAGVSNNLRGTSRTRSNQMASAASATVIQTSLTEQIRPFVDSAAANDLMYPDRADRPWRYVVLHHSASTSGNYAQIDKEHRKILGYDGCGYHFVIGNGNGSEDGKIEVAQRWVNQKQGVHCRNAKSHDMDEYGIGICLIGDIDQEPPTPKQLAATQALIAFVGNRYRIKQDNVTTHAHVATSPTVCPGKYFPEESVFTGKRAASAGATLRSTSSLLLRRDY